MIEGRRGLDAFLGRLIRRYTADVAAGDIDGLAAMQARADELQAAVGLAARALTAPAVGYSWADIGRVLGVTRQTAHERYSGQRRRRPAAVDMSGRCPTTRADGERCGQVLGHDGRHVFR